ncbi:isochorismatase family protein [Bradyrhizobium sp. Leo121]|uniref:isochorismatase family protein n=1 Tax=Bradyrhizobium sp. Leo121 TaxID=1571195 RepID=UPI001FDF53CA|nr:isochorismatase family protein [Bradyrhizobium sp. Leo121]
MTQGPGTARATPDILIEPKYCALVLVDQQAGLAFGVGSIDRQMLLNNVIALARTATVFRMPIVASTSATKVYSGPLMPAIQAAIPEVVAIDRRNMNVWEDDAARGAIVATGRRKLIFSGLLTEACVTFPVLSARAAGYEVHVVGDACGGLTPVSHDLAMRRMEAAGRSRRRGSRSFWSSSATGPGMRPMTGRELSWRLTAADTASAWPMHGIWIKPA